MLPRAVSDHYRRQQGLIVATLGLVRREWATVDFVDIDGSWAKVAPRVNLLTASAQLGAAKNGAAYVAGTLAEYGDAVDALADVNPRAFAGIASDGRPLGSLLDGAAFRAKSAQSLEAGGKWLDMAVHTQIADAGRGAAGVAIAARPGVGWVRMVNPPCCGPCAVLSGKEFRYNQGFERHPRCDCVHIPTTLANPGSHFGVDPTLDQITDLSDAEREALAEGADLSRVINARRGGARGKMTTTELAKRGQVRLTPDGIFARAGSREEALSLLRQHGYLTNAARRVSTATTVAPRAVRTALDLSGIRAAKTTQEVGAALQKAIGARGKVSGFDARSLDLERTRTTAERVAELFDRYPEVRANVDVVPFKKSLTYAEAYGTFDRSGGGFAFQELTLRISQGKLGRTSKVDAMFRRDVDSGHFHAYPEGTDAMQAMVSHEFGHLVDMWGRLSGQNGWQAHEAIKTDVLAELGVVGRREATVYAHTHTSGYGRSNADEMVAEAFADVIVNGDRANPFSRALHDAYVRRLKENRT